MTLRLLFAAGDGAAAFAVFLVVSAVRMEADPSFVWSVGVDPAAGALLFALLWVGAFWAMGLYQPRIRWSLMAAARDVARGALLVLALTLSLLFLFHQDEVSRTLLASLFGTQFVVTLTGRAALRRWFERMRRRGQDTTNMLIVGTGRLAQDFADRIEAHRSLGIQVVGHLSAPPPRRRASDAELPALGQALEHFAVTRPVLGTVDELSTVFHRYVIDEIAVCLPPSIAHYIEPIVAIAAEEGKTVRVPRSPAEGVLSGALTEEFDGFLVESVIHDGRRDLERALKRLLDLIGAGLAILVLSPVLVIVAGAIRLRDGAPVVFRQTRIGLHGRPFTIYKFRTMAADADERYADVANLSETQGAAFKMTNDPRVTPLGRILRKWTLDELPQLINVLKGDMSLVGPRPAPPREVDQYDMWHRRRLSVRPGMTGLWQVQARFDHHFDDRAALDLRYIDQWSLWMDLNILLKTVPAVLTPRGR